MPELAEVEFYRKQWDPGIGQRVSGLSANAASRVFRDCDLATLERVLPGWRLVGSEAHGKRMLFRFEGKAKAQRGWLGLHLGMSGRLVCQSTSSGTEKHAHLVLVQEGVRLSFIDPRQFGHVLFAQGAELPEWWRDLPPQVQSSEFTRGHMETFLGRHRRTTIKGVLLMQEGFPGLGNWMVDEILWQAEIHPARSAGELSGGEVARLFRCAKAVCRIALDTVGEDFRDPPEGWLFHARWKRGGICPATGAPLKYEKIAGRTTCWSPPKQRTG